ncbi:MAG: hypothetical protein IJO63_03155 [Bacilli bacterium]|nr:hypothetical protein [Bacilli bacterium]
MSICKKNVVILMLLICLVITGCSTNKAEKEYEVTKEHSMLLCKNNTNTVAFNFDKNNNVVGIYYESVFDLNDYYTESELSALKIYKHMLLDIISERIVDCNNAKYSCNSSYNNYQIINKVYVDNYNDAQMNELDEFYGVNYDILKQDMYYKNVNCEEIKKDNKYVIDENKMIININGTTYTSVEDMNYDLNKPEYYKKYTLTEFDGKKATIEFKEDGKCEINLKEFDSEYWNRSYCDKEQHKNMIKTAYLGGNCSYTIASDYSFNITYDGKYEHGTYCESYTDKSAAETNSVVNIPNYLIKIEFDDKYSNFTYSNGSWRYNKISGIVEYKYQ